MEQKIIKWLSQLNELYLDKITETSTFVLSREAKINMHEDIKSFAYGLKQNNNEDYSNFVDVYMDVSREPNKLRTNFDDIMNEHISTFTQLGGLISEWKQRPTSIVEIDIERKIQDIERKYLIERTINRILSIEE